MTPDLFAPGARPIMPRSTGFLRCERCSGLGFLRAGDFADRTFPRCPVCNGIGQAYLEASKP
jgi:hypothetical protein